MIRTALAATLLSLLPLGSAVAGPHIRVGVVAPPPPAPLVVVRPAPFHPRAVWNPGYWHWNGWDHVWIRGHWTVPPRPVRRVVVTPPRVVVTGPRVVRAPPRTVHAPVRRSVARPGPTTSRRVPAAHRGRGHARGHGRGR